jgi:hypothetical protein
MSDPIGTTEARDKDFYWATIGEDPPVAYWEFAIRVFLRHLGCAVFSHDWFRINDRDRKCVRCGRLDAEPWSPHPCERVG